MEGLIELIAPYLGDPVGSPSDGNYKYRCPFHKGGMERRPAFYINSSNGLAFCHRCNQGWNLLSLLKNLGCGHRIRDTVATMLEEMPLPVKQRRHLQILPEELIGIFGEPPPDLLAHGFSQEVLLGHEVGVDPRRGWPIYPIRDHLGRLVGISGRAPDHRKYHFYGAEDLTDFADLASYRPVPKSQVLWNFHRIYPRGFHSTDVGQIIVVEGFKAAMWVEQCGYRDVVAVFGSYLSDEQATLLNRIEAEVIVFLDQDPAGQQAVGRFVDKLGDEHTVRVVSYPRAGKLQPDDLQLDEIIECVENATRRTKMSDHSARTYEDMAGNKGGQKFKSRGMSRFPWNPGPSPEKIRLIRGYYWLCQECGGHVDADNEGKYECWNTIWDKTKDGKWVEVKTCRHTGKLPDTAPYAIHYKAYGPNWGAKGKGWSAICNCHKGKLLKPCNVCAHERTTKVFASQAYAFGLIRLRQFHVIEEPSKTDADKTYKNFVECAGRVCEGCKKGLDKVRGKSEYLSLSRSGFNELMAIEADIGRQCKSCVHGRVATMGWCCTSCGDIMTSVDDAQPLNDTEMSEFGVMVQKCAACGVTGYPSEITQCLKDVDTREPGCDEPVRTTLYDVDLELKVIATGNKRSLQSPWHSDPKPVDEDLEDLNKPWKFSRLAEVDTGYQAEVMHVDDIAVSGAAISQSSRTRLPQY